MALKMRIFANIFLKETNKKLPLGVGVQDPMTSSKNLKPAPIVSSPKKSSNPKFQDFLNRNYKTYRIFRWFEFSSSICWGVM